MREKENTRGDCSECVQRRNVATMASRGLRKCPCAALDGRVQQRPSVHVHNGVAVIDHRPIPLRNITVHKPIASGAHGSVFEGIETGLGRKVAVKLWYRAGEKVREGAIGEVRKLASLPHPLFVTVYQMDVVDGTPYSVMEFLPGPSVKAWLKQQGITSPNRKLLEYLSHNQKSIRQRCKFWCLYSAGLKYIYANRMLHGDPHLGNVVVFEDSARASHQLIHYHDLKADGDLLSIRILDLGTSLLREAPTQMPLRESKVIAETADKLFSDLRPSLLVKIDTSSSPEALLDVLDRCIEYILQLSSVPGMLKMDFDALSHCMPQLLGWNPFFDYEVIADQLSSIFRQDDARALINDTLWQMKSNNGEKLDAGDMAEIRGASRSFTDQVRELVNLSKRLRTLNRGTSGPVTP